MTAVQALAGAPAHKVIDWNQSNWRKVKGKVRRLQARIVKAIEAGRWGKVKALQRLLTRSFSAKALAVRRVTENQGKRTQTSPLPWTSCSKTASYHGAFLTA